MSDNVSSNRKMKMKVSTGQKLAMFHLIKKKCMSKKKNQCRFDNMSAFPTICLTAANSEQKH